MEGAEGYQTRWGDLPSVATTWGRLSSGPDCATSELPREGTGTGTHNSISRSPGEEEDNRSSGAALRCTKTWQSSAGVVLCARNQAMDVSAEHQ